MKLFLLGFETPEFDWRRIALNCRFSRCQLSAGISTGDPHTLAPASVDMIGDGIELEISELDITELIAECQSLLNSFIAENPLPINSLLGDRYAGAITSSSAISTITTTKETSSMPQPMKCSAQLNKTASVCRSCWLRPWPPHQ